MTSALHRANIPRYVTSALCALTVCVILVAALRPFHSPKNQVSWVPNEDTVRIGRDGTILSSGTFGFAGSDRPPFSLELWIEPALLWTRGTVLSFYSPSSPTSLSINQDYTELVLQRGNRSERNHGSLPQIEIADLFRKKQIFLTVTSDGLDTAIYVNGQLATKKEGFGLYAQDLSGRLIVANSPLRDNSWSGQLRGLAIYNGILSAAEVAQRYQDWTQRRESPNANNGRAAAFYAFRERAGRTIHDEGTSGIDLYIPEQFLVVNHLLLEPPWSEMYTSHSYLKDCAINIAGFVPLGFLLTAYLAVVTRAKRPALAAIFIGGSLSFLIEVLQADLPTRYSGMTDIITNTLGTAIGAVLYRAVADEIKKRFAGLKL